MSELVALLDIGSNAARFVLARIRPGAGYRVLHRERVVTRLAGGRPGTLPRRGVQAVLRGARRFLREVCDGQSPRVIAVATAAVREADHRRLLLGPLGSEGVDVEILTPRQEATLGAIAALESLERSGGDIVDLGGGSLQITRARRGRVVSSRSLPLGAVRVTRGFFKHDPPTPRELRRLRRNVREALLDALPPASPDDPLIGLGGTVRAIASIHLAARNGRRKERHRLRLLPSEVTAVRERLESLSARKRRKVRGLSAERAEIILGGVIVIEEVLTFGGYGALVVCTRGVRDGLLLRETFGRRR